MSTVHQDGVESSRITFFYTTVQDVFENAFQYEYSSALLHSLRL